MNFLFFVWVFLVYKEAGNVRHGCLNKMRRFCVGIHVLIICALTLSFFSCAHLFYWELFLVLFLFVIFLFFFLCVTFF